MNAANSELRSLSCRQFRDGEWTEHEDLVTPEIPVFLHWNKEAPRRLWAFPEGLEHLVLGHALLECCRSGEVPRIDGMHRNTEDGSLEYFLSPRPASGKEAALISRERSSSPTAGSAAHDAPAALPATAVLNAMRAFLGEAGRWDSTGCFHRAAVFDPRSGKFAWKVEDIGRHNCIDRIQGWALDREKDLRGLWLFVSARCTASLAAKIVRLGVAGIVSRSAVTTGGIACAERAGVSLAGFARDTRFTVFTDTGNLFSRNP